VSGEHVHFEAIAAWDPDRAAKAMEQHLKRANKLYRQFERSADQS